MISILFIGNSFTFANDLDVKVKEMAAFSGIEVYTSRVAYGGYHLCQYTDIHTKEGTEVENKLKERHWNYVVLQDHSLGPIKEEESFRNASKYLCERIHALGSTPVFYETWAYRPGSEKMMSTGLSYTEMCTTLKEIYRDVANDNKALSVPVGQAFFDLLSLPDGPDPLWKADDYHPCLCGTYLAAVLFCLYLLPSVQETDYCPSGNEPLSLEDTKICWTIGKSVKSREILTNP